MGPLAGIKIVELAGIGPGPMCAMLLADLGATVIRIERKQPASLGVERPLKFNPILRNRYSVAVDLRDPQGVETVLELVEQADALIEGFRPGVTERLGLGPDVCLQRNPKLVYGRMTGWGQTGPLSQFAGHDLNYLAITGVLDAIGREGEPPAVPLNLIGDYAGGSLYLAVGLLAGILEARTSGHGQVIDAAIVDGAAHLATPFFGLLAAGMWKPERGTNILDSGAPFYDCYQCADDQWLSVGPIESKFFTELLQLMEIDPAILGPQMDQRRWADAKHTLAARFRTRSRDEWVALLEASDACVAGVLSFSEAPNHPHMKAREVFVEVDGLVQPAPAPRFSRTVPDTPTPPRPMSREHTDAGLSPWFDAAKVERLRATGIVD